MIRENVNRIAPEPLALAALAWTLRDEARAQRLLDTTGLTPELLRDAVEEPGTLAAILRFLEAHEPDLVAAADGLGVTPVMLVAAREALEA
jgi:hypothetical protein